MGFEFGRVGVVGVVGVGWGIRRWRRIRGMGKERERKKPKRSGKRNGNDELMHANVES